MISRNRSPEQVQLHPSVLGLWSYAARDYSDRDQRYRRPGEVPVDTPPQRDQRVKHLQLEAAERSALQHLAIEAPAGTRHPVEVQQVLHLESRLFHARPQLRLTVAAEVPQHFVERAVSLLILRHQDDGAPAWLQRREDIAQRPQVVLHMLHHVEADHAIE